MNTFHLNKMIFILFILINLKLFSQNEMPVIDTAIAQNSSEVYYKYIYQPDTFKIIYVYVDSSFSSVSEIKSLKNDTLDGVYITYYENGQKKSCFYYKNGMIDGNFYYWNEFGQLQESGYLKKGKGKGIDFYENGAQEAKYIFIDKGYGFPIIVRGKWFYINGNKSYLQINKRKKENRYSFDKIKAYYYSGKKMVKAYMGYPKNKIIRIKKWKYWDEKGKLQKIEFYDESGNLKKKKRVLNTSLIF